MFQTNLTVTYTDLNTEKFLNVHPDNLYEISNGLLSFESLSGDKIIYVPADKILMFHTTCEEVKNG